MASRANASSLFLSVFYQLNSISIFFKDKKLIICNFNTCANNANNANNSILLSNTLLETSNYTSRLGLSTNIFRKWYNMIDSMIDEMTKITVRPDTPRRMLLPSSFPSWNQSSFGCDCFTLPLQRYFSRSIWTCLANSSISVVNMSACWFERPEIKISTWVWKKRARFNRQFG